MVFLRVGGWVINQINRNDILQLDFILWDFNIVFFGGLDLFCWISTLKANVFKVTYVCNYMIFIMYNLLVF